MQTVEEFKNEESLNKKIRQKRRIRGVLIIVNALLIAYASYLSVTSIVDVIKNTQEKEEGNVITLLDKSVNKSLQLYDKYITDKVDVCDVATYGNYLLFSDSRVTPTSFVNSGNVTLFRVVEDNPSFSEPNLVYTLNKNIDSQINLFNLDEGDYLIYSNFDITASNIRNAYHYTGSDMFTETLYSLPSKDGSRTKITIKGKDSSPALVISVTNVSACPEEYYDFVLLNNTTTLASEYEWVNELSKIYKIKEVNSLVDAYKTDAGFAISLEEGTEILTTNYLSGNYTSSELITSGPLTNMDINNSIRELGGYLFNAGYGVSVSESSESISSSSIAIKNNLSSSHKGKMTIVIGNEVEKEVALQTIKEVYKL